MSAARTRQTLTATPLPPARVPAPPPSDHPTPSLSALSHLHLWHVTCRHRPAWSPHSTQHCARGCATRLGASEAGCVGGEATIKIFLLVRSIFRGIFGKIAKKLYYRPGKIAQEGSPRGGKVLLANAADFRVSFPPQMRAACRAAACKCVHRALPFGFAGTWRTARQTKTCTAYGVAD